MHRSSKSEFSGGELAEINFISLPFDCSRNEVRLEDLFVNHDSDLPGPSMSLNTEESNKLKHGSHPGRLRRTDGKSGSGTFSSSLMKSVFRGFGNQAPKKSEEGSSSPALVRTLQKDMKLPECSTPNVLQRPYQDVNARYKLGKVIGSGTYGIVYSCVDKLTKDKLACKSVDKARLQNLPDIQAVRAEVRALEAVGGHPSVVTLKGVYEDLKAVHLVMELCEGGELFEQIQRKGSLPEKDVAQICKSLVSVLSYCHSLGIMHRDLKPENIMLASRGCLTDIRLVDFGHAGFVQQGSSLREMVGTAMYVAPEVLRQHYGCQADLWSLGMCLFVLLTGRLPFEDAEDDQQVFRQVERGRVEFEEGTWRGVSPEARHLVGRLLVKDPSRRITADGVEGHPWVLKYCGKVADPVRIPVFELRPVGEEPAN